MTLLIVKLDRITFTTPEHPKWRSTVETYKLTSNEKEHKELQNISFYTFIFPQCSFVINKGNSVPQSLIFQDNGRSQVVNSKEDVDKCIYSLWKTSTSLSIGERETLPYYNQHLFSGLSKSAHPRPRIPDNWPFNGSPQCNTVCALADCNQCPSLQQYNSYLFSAERIAPLMCWGYLLLLITVVCFHPLPAPFKCCHCMLLKSAKRPEQGQRTKRRFSHQKKCHKPEKLYGSFHSTD